jgi:hypothetical protein
MKKHTDFMEVKNDNLTFMKLENDKMIYIECEDIHEFRQLTKTSNYYKN